MSDLPGFLRGRETLVERVCVLVVWLAVAIQLAEAFEVLTDPWLPLGSGFLSSAALGVDAWVVGVRKERARGPSIANLSPGGWACFGAMLWIVAVPAYFFGARRRVKRGDDEGIEVEPVTWGSWVAIAIVFVIGALTSLGGVIG